jgi:hypothetical protein
MQRKQDREPVSGPKIAQPGWRRSASGTASVVSASRS